MILQIILALLGSIVLGYFFLYYQPKRKIQSFAKKAESQGYKVKLMPYQFMRFYLVKYLRQDQKCLRIFKEDLLNYDLIVGNMFTSLAIIPIHRQLVKDTYNQMSKLPKNPFIAEAFQLLNGGGIVFSQGESWRRKRKIISSVFHFDFLNDMIPLIEEEIQMECKEIDKKIQNGQNINMLMFVAKVLSSVVTKSFFGVDMNQYKIQGKPYCEYFVEFLDEIGSFSSSLQHMLFGMHVYNLGLSQQSRKIKKKYNIFNSISKEIILKQIQKIKNNEQMKKNMLTALYENGLLSLDNQNKPDQYSTYDLIGQFLSFFAAGTDTTANTINLAFHYICENPKYLSKVREQTQNLSKQKQMSQPDKIKNMRWTDSIFNQCLRLNGPVSALVPRKVSQNLQLGKIQIPKGSTVSMMPMLNHYRPQYFENPHVFQPERWMQDIKLEPYTYTPFGGGERNCIGQYLAKIEAKLLITKIVERYDIKALHPIKMRAAFVYATQYGQFSMKKREI